MKLRLSLFPVLLLPAALLCACERQQEQKQQQPTPDEVTAAPDPRLDSLSWLLGHWQGEADGNLVQEKWMGRPGQPLRGYGFTLSGTAAPADTLSSERLRIELRHDSVIYLAGLDGQQTAFRKRRLSDSTAQFENPAHNFPQQISYRLRPDGSLLASVSGTLQGQVKKQEVVLRKVK